MIRILAAVVAGGIIFGTGLLHGHRTNRWKVDEALQAAAARIDGIPMTIGDWEGTDREIDDRELLRAQANRIFARQYKNQKTGKTISTVIVCGRPGTVAVHTPDVCFEGAGRRAVAKPERFSTEGLVAEMFTTDFTWKDRIAPGLQRVFWMWSAEADTWSAPDNPRIEFMWKPSLYKLYLVHMTDRVDAELESDEAMAFAKDFLPAVNQALYGEEPKKVSNDG